MKTITSDYKNNVKLFGREIDCKITYEYGSSAEELGAENLNSVSLHYEGAILKSVMKQLDIECDRDIPLWTEINAQFGVKVGNVYEYIDLGNFIVYKSEKQEDMRSYKLTCYDKMILSMKNYENVHYVFPMTVRDYIDDVCASIGLVFANSTDTFANYNRQLTEDMFLDADKKYIGYTFRDVLDQLAEVTASIICINEDDELEIRYINNTNDTIDENYLKDINVNFGEKYGPINSVVLSRAGESDNVYLQDSQSVTTNGLCEIKIVDNQIMSKNDRSDYLQDILNVLDGLEYYINDFSSTGITYYELGDRYTISIDNNTYSCIMFNDEINITQGLEENIYAEMPEQSETDYTKSDKTDRKINQAYIIVDKQNQEINSVVQNVNTLTTMVNSQGDSINALGTRLTQNINTITASVSAIQSEIDNGVGLVKTTSATLDNSGLIISTDTSKITTKITNDTFEIKNNGGNRLAFFGYDENEGISKAEMDNLTVDNYFIAGVHRVETYTENYEERTGWFYIGG